jgi:transcription elongation factor Elf1
MDETNVECPYCGESFVALVDWSEGETSYIQDCEVCCQPIVFRLHPGLNGAPGTVSVQAEDG